MQKAESLSFQTVLGLDGRGQSLMNEISIGAVVEIMISTEFYVICDETFFEKTNHILIPTYFSTKRKTISQRDEL